MQKILGVVSHHRFVVLSLVAFFGKADILMKSFILFFVIVSHVFLWTDQGGCVACAVLVTFDNPRSGMCPQVLQQVLWCSLPCSQENLWLQKHNNWSFAVHDETIHFVTHNNTSIAYRVYVLQYSTYMCNRIFMLTSKSATTIRKSLSLQISVLNKKKSKTFDCIYVRLLSINTICNLQQ